VISRETIDEVKSRIDIVDVISDFVSLKKSGANYKALSPFNNEKTPSFYVVPTKGIFKDFSSGKGGDAVTFVMEHEGMSYIEAIRYLGKKYGVEIQETQASAEQQAAQSEREGLYVLMNFARDFYHDKLLHSDEGKSIGLSYFRERGFNDRDIQKFELGYALEGWEHFSKEAISKGYNKELLEKTGLVVKKEDGSTYDRFRGRVIFPIHNLSGKVVAFGARMMGKDKNQPKYINSPETEIYHKSDVLFGLHLAKNPMRQHDNCYLVEGYTDVISMHQCDVTNVVASSGTALTDGQIRLIRRFTENITVLFDGDAAGIKAALRGIDMILQGGLNVRVVLFPDGEDPDSYSRKVGTAAFQAFLKQHTQDFVSFKAGLFAKEAAGDPIRKAESIKEIVTSIALIPDAVKRSVYIQETSSLLKISESVLLAEMNKGLINERRKRETEKQRLQTDEQAFLDVREQEAEVPLSIDMEKVVHRQERETIRLLLKYADKKLTDQVLGFFLVNELDDVTFLNPVYKQIFDDFIRAAESGSQVDTDFFISHSDPNVRSVAAELLVDKYTLSRHWFDKYKIAVPPKDADLEKGAAANVRRLKYRLIQLWGDSNMEKLKLAKSEEEETEILEKQRALMHANVSLAEELAVVTGKY
jgi:DNA primase